VFWEFAKRKLATRKDKIKIIKTKRDSYTTCLPLVLTVSREERCEVLACFHVAVKMYRYSLEEQVFIVKTYWITGSIKNCQRRFTEQFGGRNPPSKCCI
jgi:RNase P/RNase MRP subunit POP5